ncbi:hypothetical protein GCM10010124_36370 [Pilimelia terevasa]|uniref:Uncharacterized protein n=1 Tax=Pilimelia terevasa TaxID=53372 RepID=A0A8J3BUW7_9ACTN|nr:hypothetical protein [Pilimelia terevasa]GGK40358.1 hypothetical protein GCM10010124_36370 [Pilimelia terevasa]
MRLSSVLAVLALAAAGSVVAAGPAAAATVWGANPPAGNRLVTNEYAYWNRGRAGSLTSPSWEMTSGSLYARRTSAGSVYWSGRPDDRAPDARSASGTNSAVFRLTTKAATFRDTTVRTRLNIAGLTATRSTPRTDWDGIHLFLRYRGERHLYYASVARRDGHVVLKKKCPGGSSNGGTYYTLAERAGHRIPYGRWRWVSASARNHASGAVSLYLSVGDRLVLRATDRDTGCGAIRAAGRVGVRGDNANFTFQSFRAARL